MEGSLLGCSKYPLSVKVLEVDSWVHISRVKPAPINLDPSTEHQRNPDSTYTCELLEDLKILFRKEEQQTSICRFFTYIMHSYCPSLGQ